MNTNLKLPKIFGLGLSKTGTKSTAKALQILGVKTIHLPSIQTLFNDGENYQAFLDIPCLAFLPQIRELYPNALFINTTRDLKPWLSSCQNHFKPTNNAYFLQLRKLIYDCDKFDEVKFINAYRQQQEIVNEVDENIICTLKLEDSDNDKWQVLSTFLNFKNPKIKYPHL